MKVFQIQPRPIKLKFPEAHLFEKYRISIVSGSQKTCEILVLPKVKVAHGLL